jgi:hypothetical protein
MIAVALLGVLSLGGLAGGLAFVTDPTGGRLGMTVDQLPTWLPVRDYLVPGIALIVLFGLLPAVVAWLHVRRSPRAWTATAAVGVLLVIWSGAQIAAIGLVFLTAQIGFLIVGIVLTGLGVDGGASVGTSDDYARAGRSYVHADDER